MKTRIPLLLGLSFLLVAYADTAQARQTSVTMNFQLVDQALVEILQELARLEGVSENASLSACRRMHNDIIALRRQVARLQSEIREASGASVSVSIDVSDSGSRRGKRERGKSRAEASPPPPPPTPEIVGVPAEAIPTAPQPMNKRDLERLIARMEQESFPSAKLLVLDDAADYAWLTSAQVVKILGLFTFARDQLKALELIVRNIVDHENAFEIYSAFTFDSDKEKARKIIRAARQ